MRIDIIKFKNGTEYFISNRILTEELLTKVDNGLIEEEIHSHLVVNSIEDLNQALKEMRDFERE